MAVRQAEAMFQMASNHHFAFGHTAQMALKHFAIIEKDLEENESASLCFIGMNNYRGRKSGYDYCACVLTERRFIIAQKKRLGETCTSIYWPHLNRIGFEEQSMLDVLIIDSLQGVFHIGLSKDHAREISEQAIQIYHQFSKPQTAVEPASQQTVQDTVSVPPPDAALQIRQFKQLLDEGLLTEEEFTAVKKKILGI